MIVKFGIFHSKLFGDFSFLLTISKFLDFGCVSTIEVVIKQALGNNKEFKGSKLSLFRLLVLVKASSNNKLTEDE